MYLYCTATIYAYTCIYIIFQECHPEQLFSESKFLTPQSLLELVKSLTFASRGPEDHVSLGTSFHEETAVFFLELLVSVAMENKYALALPVMCAILLGCMAASVVVYIVPILKGWQEIYRKYIITTAATRMCDNPLLYGLAAGLCNIYSSMGTHNIKKVVKTNYCSLFNGQNCDNGLFSNYYYIPMIILRKSHNLIKSCLPSMGV